MIYYRAIFDFPDGEYIVDRRNITALNVGQKDRGSTSDISFGIYCNSGHISFIDDAERTILRYASEGKLVSGIKCKVYLVNSLAKSSAFICEMKTQKWHYDNNNFSVSVDIKDELEEWQEIEVSGIPIQVDYDGGDYVISSAKELDVFIADYFSPLLAQNNYAIVSKDWGNAFTRIKIRNPILEQCSLWSFGAKLCDVSASRIYKLRDTIYMKYYGGE